VIKINGRVVAKTVAPYIIAELSANHGGSIDRAKASMQAAQEAGVDAVKIQTYTTECLTLNSDKEDFLIRDGLWKGYNLYDLYTKAHTPFEWHEELFSFAANIGMTLFSSPFSEAGLELLVKLSAPAFKVASFELVDLPLIENIAKCGKPVLLSTGLGSIEEISEAVETIRLAGNTEILLFHCVSSYPTPISHSHLRNIQFLREEFHLETGLSDHTTGTIAATTAIALGATAIEKHFKLDDQEESPDSSFSLSPTQLAHLVDECKDAWSALGPQAFQRPKVEEGSKVFRRSLYFIRDMAAGEIVSEKDVKSIRPGYGLPPKFLNSVIGLELREDAEHGEAVSWKKFGRSNSSD